MNKKGFTLIELLGVVTLIVLISLIVIPNIALNINEKKAEISKANMKLLSEATDVYIQNHQNQYVYTYEANGSTYCIPIQSLINDGILTTPFTDINGKEIDYSNIVKATYQATYNGFSYDLVESGECTEVINYVSKPVLSDGMIPVIYDDGGWKKADITSKWYNYSDQKWANAVLVNEAKSDIENSKSRYEYTESPSGTEILESDILAYFVWIPRFRYQLFDSNSPISINIVFENVGTSRSRGTQTGEWLTHPAFTVNGQELSGIWVSKYEASNQNNSIIIKKDQTPWVSIDYNSANQVSISMTNQNNMYGLNNVNTHLIKNSEWSAVTYLTQSKYGFNNKIDVSTSTKTGNSNSTTGNITGIYDMSGVSKEFVILDNENENSLGYSLSETKSWYSDTNTFISNENPYLTRGKTSIFNYSSVSSNGTDTSFRVALINNNTSSDNQIVIPIANEVEGVKYFDTTWINNTPIYFNPTTGQICTDYKEENSNIGVKSGCMKWYAYSENSDGTVNMILDHNTTSSVSWMAISDYDDENYNTVAQSFALIAQPSLDNNQWPDYETRGNHSKGPLTVLKQLREDTINWKNENSRNDIYTVDITNDKSQKINYTISYEGYNARLITAEEVANITGANRTFEDGGINWKLSDGLWFIFNGSGEKWQTSEENSSSTTKYDWLLENTKNCILTDCSVGQEDTDGYWTASPNSSHYYDAFSIVNSNSSIGVGVLSSTAVNGGNDSYIRGIRPVITVSKNSIF